MAYILSQGLLCVKQNALVVRNSGYTYTTNLDYINCFETEKDEAMGELLDLNTSNGMVKNLCIRNLFRIVGCKEQSLDMQGKG